MNVVIKNIKMAFNNVTNNYKIHNVLIVITIDK